MLIKLSNLKEIYKEEKNEIYKCIDRVLRSGNLILSKEMISLPVHQYLKKKHLIYMVKKIKEFYKK